MDPGEIPHRDDLVPSSPRVDGKRLWQSTTLDDHVSKVLGNDDLLIEILLLISYPTTLICAALVCKRWFYRASDPAFLRRFYKLHSPRLLGFYVNTRINYPRFVPILPQPTEFDVPIRRATSNVDSCINTPKFFLDDWNDIVITNKFKNYNKEPESGHIVLNPLCPERGMVIVPPFPYNKHRDEYLYSFGKLLFKEECDKLSYYYVDMELDGTNSTVDVYMLQHGVWCIYTSVTTQLPCLPWTLHPLLVDNKIYMASTPSEILMLDLKAISLSTYQVPEGLVISYKRTMLSRANDNSGVYLIHLDKHQLCIWFRTGDNWLLVDTICLPDMFAKLMMADLTDWVWINHVGFNAEFVFLQTNRCLIYVDIKCKKFCEVYEMTSEDQFLGRIHPCMMIWPPTFPALKDDPASDAI